jgi:hypothetical protein
MIQSKKLLFALLFSSFDVYVVRHRRRSKRGYNSDDQL